MMSLRLAEKEELNIKKSYPLLYLVKNDSRSSKGVRLQTNGGVFFVFIIAIIFLCLGILLNFGLRVQNINYQKKIYGTNEMISIEEERTDRLLLKVSELKSPFRIINAAEDELGMEISDKMEIVKISSSNLNNSEKIYDYIVKNPTLAVENYDNFLGTIYNIRNIVMVVSESVLTFFIP